MSRLALPLLALTLATPAMAADFALPKGCEAFLTVQAKGCTVSLLWRCDVSPAGEFSEASFGADGLESLTTYAASYQWLDSVYTWDNSREEFLPPAKDPIDFHTLLETGVDTYDFAMHRSDPDGSHEIFAVGSDRLVGETRMIDGYSMDVVRTNLKITAEDGTVEYQSEGFQYFSRALELFFLGTETVVWDDGTSEVFDNTPVDIMHPGEPGFGKTEPLYECQQQNAALLLPPGAQPG